MGSKNGKYDFEHENSLQNRKETLPSYPSESNGSILTKKVKREASSIPQCIHQDFVHDALSTNMDNLSLVWLDTNIYRRSSNIDTEVKLKNLINYIRVFDDVAACEKYIKQIGKMNSSNSIRKEKLLVIISTTLAPTLIPHLHDLSQVQYIYVFGKAKTISKAHQEWLRKYKKVCNICERFLIFSYNDDFTSHNIFFSF
jgi:hypothetical protein